MKTLIIFFCLVSLTLGEIVASNKYEVDFKENLNFIHDRHNTQHEQSVNAARQKLQESLSKYDSQSGFSQGSSYGNSYGSSGSQRYVAGCSTCYGGAENRASYTSRQSSTSSSRNSQGVDSNYNGVGILGHTSDRYATANENDDVQSLVGPSYTGSSLSSRFSSQSAHEAEDMQQRVVPSDLSSIQSSAYHSANNGYEEEDLQSTASTIKPFYGGSVFRKKDESYSEDRVSSGFGYTSEGSQTSSQNRGTGQVINLAVRPGTSTVLAVPVRVIHTTGVADNQQNVVSRNSEYSSGSESSSRYPSSTTYRVVYTPSRNSVTSNQLSSTYQSENSRTSGGVQQPEKLVSYNSYAPESSSHSRFNAEERNTESSQVRVAPVAVNYPSNGGSSRVAYGSSQSSQSQNRVVVPVAPINTVETVTSTRTAEERDERRYTPASPTYVSSTRNSNSAAENRNQVYSGSRVNYTPSDRFVSGSSNQGASHYGTSGSTYYAPSRTYSQNQHQLSSGSQTQHQRQGGYTAPYTGGRISNAQSSDYLSQRFGSGMTSLNTDDLHAYMSESERLAKLQQQQISGSSSGSSLSASELNRQTVQKASALDSSASNFIQNSQVGLGSRFGELDSLNANGAGGFQRVTSWNKQSKWSSGSEYGPDGKPKTYSSLSTAEAEKHNINGHEVGYKAATSTLENDGKVSTYSIHT